MIGGLVPGAWLAAVSAAALARRRGPVALAAIGVLTGIALAGLLAGVQLSMTAPGAVARTLTVASLTVFAAGCPVWTTWSGIRLLRGRSELPARAGDTPARR